MALQERVKARLADAAAEAQRASLLLSSASNGAAAADAADDDEAEDEDDGAGSRDSDSLASPSPGVGALGGAGDSGGAPLHISQFGAAFKVGLFHLPVARPEHQLTSKRRKTCVIRI
jgi:hypothetical protein